MMKPALIAVALLMATPTTAAEITRAGDVVTIKGMIWGQDAEKFASMTRGMPPVTVSLDSAGRRGSTSPSRSPAGFAGGDTRPPCTLAHGVTGPAR